MSVRPPIDRKSAVARSREAAELDLADLEVGQIFTLEHCFGPDEVDRFADLSGDFSPLHVDDGYAGATEFGARVVHGMLLASLFSTLVGMKIPGSRALYLSQDLHFRRPVLIGEPIVATAKVTAINPALAVIQLTMTITKADSSVAVTGAGKVRVRDSAAAAPQVSAAPQAKLEVDGRPVALVTGASRGIGAAIAKRLAADGFAVAINYRSNEAAAARVVEAIAKDGGVGVPFCADIRDKQAAKTMVSALIGRFGRLDLLVNNAALAYEMKSAMDTPWSDVAEQLEASVRAPLALCKLAYPALKEHGGAVVNVISQVVENTPPRQMLDYVIGKYGLLGLTRALATEWAEHGIRVNGVSPSLVETDMTSHFKDRVFKLEASRTPLRRLATLDDVAATVSFLGGPNAAFLTGLVVPVSGGQTMK